MIELKEDILRDIQRLSAAVDEKNLMKMWIPTRKIIYRLMEGDEVRCICIILICMPCFSQPVK